MEQKKLKFDDLTPAMKDRVRVLEALVNGAYRPPDNRDSFTSNMSAPLGYIDINQTVENKSTTVVMTFVSKDSEAERKTYVFNFLQTH